MTNVGRKSLFDFMLLMVISFLVALSGLANVNASLHLLPNDVVIFPYLMKCQKLLSSCG